MLGTEPDFIVCRRHIPPHFDASFYRAMLYIARIMLSQDVCLSVCHTPHVETVKQTLKLFLPSSSHTMLAFTKQYGNILTANVGDGDLRPISRFISEMTQDRHSYNGKLLVNRMWSTIFLMTLNFP